MSLLLDTSALVAARNAEDKNHNQALEVMMPALQGEYGKLFVTDYIFDSGIRSACEYHHADGCG